ncbi:glycoside hydrolase family 27 protein [Pleurotus ostreatus PC15]|uniref:Alpha-galactosidase n=1 Tax=Pleurotus ostreatus (strain PC15) TaxID=1137138 RepID=A0A067NTX6_PLEO1|nr:glycoside hydrolase family 27 protein [Pleurotus ostreatus PC15]
MIPSIIALAIWAVIAPINDVQSSPTAAPEWNSWNAYRCDINENKTLAAANQFVSLGLKDVGYEYVNIDVSSCMAHAHTSTKRIIPDSTKFPNGINTVASKIHDLGLKMGIYSDAGTATCAGYPGSLGFEAIDAATFSEWGIDYNCNVPRNWTDVTPIPGNDWYNSNSSIRYRQMTAALVTQTRPIQFSLCIWGTANVWDWGARVGHSWRMGGDSSPTWSYITSIININIAHLSSINFFAHNDMDMMEIGNGALTIQEQRTHFAAWIMFKRLGKLNSTQLAIIKNKELLAFHQDDTIGTPAAPFTARSGAPVTSPPEFYSGKSSKGTHVFIINTSGSDSTKQFTFANVPGLRAGGRFKIHDMWTGQDLSGTHTSSFSANVAAHDTAAFLITPV